MQLVWHLQQLRLQRALRHPSWQHPSLCQCQLRLIKMLTCMRQCRSRQRRLRCAAHRSPQPKRRRTKMLRKTIMIQWQPAQQMAVQNHAQTAQLCQQQPSLIVQLLRHQLRCWWLRALTTRVRCRLRRLRASSQTSRCATAWRWRQRIWKPRTKWWRFTSESWRRRGVRGCAATFLSFLSFLSFFLCSGQQPDSSSCICQS